MPLSRRAFILGTGAALLVAGCSREGTVSAAPVDFLGPKRQPGDPLYSVESKAYLTAFEPELLSAARTKYAADLYATCRSGVVALHDRCPFDRVRVSYCPGEQGYGCPSCSSIFNRIGEVLGGASMRGLDHITISLDSSGQVVLDSKHRVDGPPRGTVLVAVDDAGQTALVKACLSGNSIDPTKPGPVS